MKNGTASSGVALTEPSDRHAGQQHHEDRKADQKKNDRHDEKGKRHSHTLPSAGAEGAACSASRLVMTVPRRQHATSRISAKPSATAPCGIHMGTPAMSLARPIRNIWAA